MKKEWVPSVSAADFSSNALATALDKSGGEELASQNMTKNCVVCGPFLPCPRLSGVFLSGSMRRPKGRMALDELLATAGGRPGGPIVDQRPRPLRGQHVGQFGLATGQEPQRRFEASVFRFLA